MKKNKILSTMMVCSMIINQAGALTMVSADEVSTSQDTQESILEKGEEKEITSITPKRKVAQIEYSYGTSYDESIYSNLYTFVDQDGVEIPKELLNIDLVIQNYLNQDIGSPESVHNTVFESPTVSTPIYFLRGRASLKANPNVVSDENPNAQYVGIGLKSINKDPFVKVLKENITMYEGEKYDPYANIEYGDFEDDRDGKEVQFTQTIPSNMNIERLERGNYMVVHKVKDSQGAVDVATEYITVLEAPAPVIKASKTHFTARQGEFDVKELGYKAIDDLDGDITDRVEVVKNNVNLQKEGTYEVVLKVENDHFKTTQETFKVEVESEGAKITIEQPEKIEFKGAFNPLRDLKYTAIDAVDGDITQSIMLEENHVNTDRSGKYEVVLSVVNSNGKKSTQSVYVEVDSSKPVIKAEKTEFKAENKEFDVKDMNIKAHDEEDGNLTEKVRILENNVNLKKEGKYIVKASVSNEYGNTTVQEIEVNVKADKPILEADDSIELEKTADKVDLLELINKKAMDNVDGDITDKVIIKESNVNTQEQGLYKLTLSVMNSNGKETTKEVIVNVKGISIPLIPLEPSNPIETPEEPSIPLIPLEPSKPNETPEEPEDKEDVEKPEDKEDVEKPNTNKRPQANIKPVYRENKELIDNTVKQAQKQVREEQPQAQLKQLNAEKSGKLSLILGSIFTGLPILRFLRKK